MWYERHSLTQVELARLLGVRPSHVTEWKKGRNLPNAETALTMLELSRSVSPKPSRNGLSFKNHWLFSVNSQDQVNIGAVKPALLQKLQLGSVRRSGLNDSVPRIVENVGLPLVDDEPTVAQFFISSHTTVLLLFSSDRFIAIETAQTVIGVSSENFEKKKIPLLVRKEVAAR